jgi:hypothetical protein
MKVLIAVLSPLLLFVPIFGSASELSRPYTVTVGEMIEVHCGIWDGLTSFSSQGLLGSTYSALVYYSKGADIIQVVYPGDRESIDNAKLVLDMMNQQVLPKIMQYAKTKFDIDLGPSNFLLIYRNKANDTDILLMENGKYVFPK